MRREIMAVLAISAALLSACGGTEQLSSEEKQQLQGITTAPVSVWPSSTIPAAFADGDATSNELGMKFKATAPGVVTGVRFYKGAKNTGTHVGHLWTSSGSLLGSVTFSNEAPTGWQNALFSSPIAIQPDTVYVVSYFAPTGHYPADRGYFASAGRSSGPLYALRDGEAGGNGVYLRSDAAGFPTDTYNTSNYYVDVLFVPSATVSGLTGQYFGNESLTNVLLTRTDPQVDFNWGVGSPGPALAADSFSARWTGQVLAPVTGTYTFSTSSDDGVRLWVNGKMLVDNWTLHASTTNSGQIALTAGQRYDLKLEYYEHTGDASINLAWTVPGQSRMTIPSSQLFKAQASSPTCTPSCSGKQCGADGCGGICGTCATDHICGPSGLCVATTPKPTPSPANPAAPFVNGNAPLNGITPAFPGAEGGGSLSKGGRGGAVYEVTNLNDSGSGSLRACVSASGPRTCVFRVGGTLTLNTTLWVLNPFITIAGQTAPGGGIQIVGPFSAGNAASPNNAAGQSTIVIATHDVVMRYLRVRHGLVRGDLCNGNGCDWNLCRSGNRQGGACANGSIPDAISLSPAQGDDHTVENVILDHISSQWGEGKSFGMWNNIGVGKLRNVTVQYSLAGETLRGNSTAFIAGTDNPGCESTRAIASSMINIDMHHNLGINSSHRFPLVKVKSARWVSNIVYNWGLFATQIGGGANVDVVSNIYKKGPMTNRSHEIQVYPWTANTNPPSGDPSLFISGNVGPNNSDPSADNWGKMTYFIIQETAPEGQAGEYVLDGSAYRRNAPMAAYGAAITVTPTRELENLVLAQAGAAARLDCTTGTWLNARDMLDARMVRDYLNGTGPLDDSLVCTGSGCVPQSELQTPEGGFPLLAAGAACTDSDHDGMPDVWETAHGLNPNSAADGSAVQADRYTNLEHYLSGR